MKKNTYFKRNYRSALMSTIEQITRKYPGEFSNNIYEEENECNKQYNIHAFEETEDYLLEDVYYAQDLALRCACRLHKYLSRNSHPDLEAVCNRVCEVLDYFVRAEYYQNLLPKEFEMIPSRIDSKTKKVLQLIRKQYEDIDSALRA